MSKGLPDPLGLHSKFGAPDPLGIMAGSKENLAKQATPTAAALPVRGAEPSDPKLKERASGEFATREAAVQRQAVAAGAQRSENEADLLGYSPVKRKSAARALLG